LRVEPIALVEPVETSVGTYIQHACRTCCLAGFARLTPI